MTRAASTHRHRNDHVALFATCRWTPDLEPGRRLAVRQALGLVSYGRLFASCLDFQSLTFCAFLPSGSIVCNVGDILMAFTGGRFKSSWHTVLRPPPPQENLDRFSLVYFSRPNYNALCRPLVPVPQEELEGFVPIDYETWVNRKIARLNAKGKNFIHAEPTFEMVNHWRPLLEVGYDEENEGDGARYKNGVLVEK